MLSFTPVVAASIPTWSIVTIIILVILIAAFIALAIAGSKMQKKQQEAEANMMVGAQTVSMLIIDKKKMKLADAGFPDIVLKQTPWYLKRSKVPVVKAKVGPQVMTLICDEGIFDDVPQHGEVKAMISGIYIISVRAVHKQTRKATEEQASTRKKTFREKMLGKQADYQKQLDQELANRKAKEDEKKIKAEEKKKRERAKKIVD